ncbi:MAG: hypothetical protein ACRDI2_10820, partial [Chloroflexota bacterium]
GISVVDGYWIGREPWTSAGVIVVLAGSALALLAAAAATMARGDWVRRVLLIPVLAMPILWWMTALGAIPYPRFDAPDPVTLAYSVPGGAAVALILPALGAAALALLPIGPDLRPRMRPIHAAQRHASTDREGRRGGQPDES